MIGDAQKILDSRVLTDARIMGRNIVSSEVCHAGSMAEAEIIVRDTIFGDVRFFGVLGMGRADNADKQCDDRN